MSGIREILLISTKQHIGSFRNLLGDGSRYGISIEYAIQEKAMGLAQAFTIGENFVGSDNVALILGDNIFYGGGLGTALQAQHDVKGANIFAYHVGNPEQYGVIEIDDLGNALSIEEKPKSPKSNFAIPGLYYYDNSVLEVAQTVKPSSRGELEISTINEYYLNAGQLNVTVLDRGTTWLDTGTYDSLLEAGEFVQVVEKRQGLKIGCVEEVAWRMGYISSDELATIAKECVNEPYAEYLENLDL